MAMNWKRALLLTAGIGVPVMALLSYGMTRDPRQIDSPLPGREAPTFEREVFATGEDPRLRLEVGDSVKLAEHKGEIVVVNFWASWCLACRDEHAGLSITASEYANDGVQFYGMLYNDKEANGVRWISQMGGQSYPGLSDPGARAAIDFGLYGVPETFVVDQHGRVARKFVGPVYPDAMRLVIDSLLLANGPSRVAPNDVPVSRPVPAGSDTSGSITP